MGQVFEADDLVLQRRVAIKVPRVAEGNELLLAEARALAALNHRHLPVVYGAGIHGEIRYIVMELLHGMSLEVHIETTYGHERPIPIGAALEMLATIADALRAIHEAGIVHRDVKPENVLLCGERGPVLLDFGLVVPEFDLSTMVLYAGSPHYMAPEMIHQKARRGAGHLADLYSFGILAYELWTGTVPFNADNLDTLLRLHIEAPIPDVRVMRPDVPAPIASLITELMAKQPGQRPQTTEDVVWRLRAVSARLGDNRAERGCVLIVSEDAEVVNALEAQLRRLVVGVDITVCLTGDDALGALEERRPQLMFVDLQLSGMTGMELLMHMHGSGVSWPEGVVALSDDARREDIDLLRHLDVASVIAKGPRLAQSLAPIVRNVLAARD
jgi:serine/threonine protein kinase